MRLFIALEPTPRFRNALRELQEHLQAAGIVGRYADPAGLHMTLAYIGEWSESISQLLPVVEEPFPIHLTHTGIFHKAGVLWAGVNPEEPLNQLSARVRKNLDEAGIPYDGQSFKAHITLIRKPYLPSEDILKGIKTPPASMTVRSVCLYRSDRTDRGMAYTVIARR